MFACLTRTTYTFSFVASALQECDRTLRQVWDQTFQAIEELQSPQGTDQHDQVGAVPGFDAFERALGNAGLVGKSSLAQVSRRSGGGMLLTSAQP